LILIAIDYMKCWQDHIIEGKYLTDIDGSIMFQFKKGKLNVETCYHRKEDR